jgi:hypothetical protein
MINDRLANMRTWALCLAVYCIACTSAFACFPGTESSILFEQVPTDIYATEIIEATIYDRTQVGDAVGRQMWLLNARVDRVIKGSIKTKTVKIILHLGCTRFGGHGIILGELEDDPQRGLVLIPKEHHFR